MSLSVDNISMMLNSAATKASGSSAEGLENTLKGDLANATDDELMAVCKEFESYFLEQVFKEMKKTIPENKDSNVANSQLTDYYMDEMIQKVASQAVEQNSGSNSLAHQLYEQMKRNYSI